MCYPHTSRFSGDLWQKLNGEVLNHNWMYLATRAMHSHRLPFQDTYAGVIVSIRMPMKRFLLSENNIKNIEEIQTNTAKNNYFFP